jgi:hypothetical protein
MFRRILGKPYSALGWHSYCFIYLIDRILVLDFDYPAFSYTSTVPYLQSNNAWFNNKPTKKLTTHVSVIVTCVDRN